MNFAKLEQLIDNMQELYGVPNCDCSVYYKHEEVFRRRTGFVDLEQKKVAGNDDLYFLYSASKVTLAVASMQLVERGLIALSDPVSKYLPEFAAMKVRDGNNLVPCKRKATIEDLLSMRGGLNYDCLIPSKRPDLERLMKEDPDFTTQEYIHQLLKEPLDFEPGSRFQYSMCLDVMGAVIEIVTGQRYSDYVRENIGKPLGMKDLYMHVPDSMKDRMVQQYAYDPMAQNSIFMREFVPLDPLSNIAIFGPNYDSAGGGIITRVSDYVLLADALANDGVGANGARILTRASIDDMRTNRLTTPVMFADHAKMQNFGYGYGLGVRTLVNQKAAKSPVGEFGWDGLGGAFFLSDVENHIALFFLMSVTGMVHIKPAVHNKLRDFTYEAMEEELRS